MTLRRLRTQLNAFEQFNHSFKHRRAFQKIKKGALALASAGALFETQLRETEAATEARKKRAKGGRRVVAKGGILYSQEGRMIIRNRAIKEALEAEKKCTNAAKRAQAKTQEKAAVAQKIRTCSP